MHSMSSWLVLSRHNTSDRCALCERHVRSGWCCELHCVSRRICLSFPDRLFDHSLRSWLLQYRFGIGMHSMPCRIGVSVHLHGQPRSLRERILLHCWLDIMVSSAVITAIGSNVYLTLNCFALYRSLVCPAGSFCPSASSTFTCPAGSYSASGQVECSTCPPGFECAASGTVTPSLCAVGYYSSGGASVCTLCSPGFICAAGSSNPTPTGSECPIGSYCNPANVLTLCPPGTYGTTAAGMSQAHACAPCLAGFYCSASGTTYSTMVASICAYIYYTALKLFFGQVVNVCPAGSYCPTGTTNPQNCPGGTYGQVTGQVSIGACSSCPRGFYCLNPGTTSPSPCPQNYFCPVGTQAYSIYPCSPGSFGVSTGYYSATQCQNCTVGNYCAGGSDPVPCPLGRYNPGEGGSAVGSCSLCELGFACPLTGMSAMTRTCNPGYYCPLGTQFPGQFACPPGTYSDAINLSQQSAW